MGLLEMYKYILLSIELQVEKKVSNIFKFLSENKNLQVDADAKWIDDRFMLFTHTDTFLVKKSKKNTYTSDFIKKKTKTNKI